MSRVEGDPIPLRAKIAAFGVLGASALAWACGTEASGPKNHADNSNNQPTATRTLESEASSTIAPPATFTPEATATAEARVLTFDEISQRVTDVYNTNPIPAGLCDASLMNYAISVARTAREAYDQNPMDFNPYANIYGRLVGEVQKIADSSGSQTFINLQKILEDSFIADARNIFSRLGAGEEDMQQFFSIWRSNWLDRESQNYDASRCGIVLPKY